MSFRSRLFLAIAHTTLAAGPLAACSEEISVDDGAEDTSALASDAAVKPETDGAALGGDVVPPGQWEPVPCPVPHALPLREQLSGVALPQAPLKTPSAITHAGVYLHTDVGLPTPAVFEIARSGAPCVDSATACEQELQRVSHQQVCARPPCRSAVVTEAGVHRRVDTREELLRRFGDIDSAAEVVLLAAFDGFDVCGGGVLLAPFALGAEVRTTVAGFELRNTWNNCGSPLLRVQLSVHSSGKVVVVSKNELNCAVGRRPPGLCPDRAPARASTSESGAYLARCAQLEHASIYAFYQLILELRAHDAPEELRLMALDAMLDEVRHARDVQRSRATSVRRRSGRR